MTMLLFSDVNSKCMNVLVNFMYTGELIVEPGHHLSVYQSAVTLNMPLVQELLQQYLKGDNLQPNVNTFIKQEIGESITNAIKFVFKPTNKTKPPNDRDWVPSSDNDNDNDKGNSDVDDDDNYDDDYVSEKEDDSDFEYRSRSYDRTTTHARTSKRRAAKVKHYDTKKSKSKRKIKDRKKTKDSKRKTKKQRKTKDKMETDDEEIEIRKPSEISYKVYIPENRENVKCDVCDKVMTSYVSLKKHLLVRHKQGGSEVYRNYVVKSNIARARNRQFVSTKRTEENDVSSKQMYGCVKCRKSFKFYSKLCRHVQTHHPPPYTRWKFPLRTLNEELFRCVALAKRKKVKCNECNQEFAAEKMLKRHIAIYHEQLINPRGVKREITCTMCGKSFSSFTSLTKHINKRHSEIDEMKADSKHECPVCKLLFDGVNDLETHCTSEHADMEQEKFTLLMEYCHKAKASTRNHKVRSFRDLPRDFMILT